MRITLPDRKRIVIVRSPSKFSLEEFTERYVQKRMGDGQGNIPTVFPDLIDYQTFLKAMNVNKEAYNFQPHNSCVDHATLCIHFNTVMPVPCTVKTYSVTHYSAALYGWKRIWE